MVRPRRTAVRPQAVLYVPVLVACWVAVTEWADIPPLRNVLFQLPAFVFRVVIIGGKNAKKGGSQDAFSISQLVVVPIEADDGFSVFDFPPRDHVQRVGQRGEEGFNFLAVFHICRAGNQARRLE